MPVVVEGTTEIGSLPFLPRPSRRAPFGNAFLRVAAVASLDERLPREELGP